MFSQLSFLYVIFIPLLAGVLLLLNYVLARKPKKQDIQKFFTYESGFDTIPSMTRTQFDIRYFRVIIAFLFFDCDISLFFPFVSLAGPTISIITNLEVTVAILSTLIFLLGLLYDLTNGLVDYTVTNKNNSKILLP